jgi:hypothetical protein
MGALNLGVSAWHVAQWLLTICATSQGTLAPALWLFGSTRPVGCVPPSRVLLLTLLGAELEPVAGRSRPVLGSDELGPPGMPFEVSFDPPPPAPQATSSGSALSTT